MFILKDESNEVLKKAEKIQRIHVFVVEDPNITFYNSACKCNLHVLEKEF